MTSSLRYFVCQLSFQKLFIAGIPCYLNLLLRKIESLSNFSVAKIISEK